MAVQVTTSEPPTILQMGPRWGSSGAASAVGVDLPLRRSFRCAPNEKLLNLTHDEIGMLQVDVVARLD